MPQIPMLMVMPASMQASPTRLLLAFRVMPVVSTVPILLRVTMSGLWRRAVALLLQLAVRSI